MTHAIVRVWEGLQFISLKGKGGPRVLERFEWPDVFLFVSK